MLPVAPSGGGGGGGGVSADHLALDPGGGLQETLPQASTPAPSPSCPTCLGVGPPRGVRLHLHWSRQPTLKWEV